MGDIHRVGLPAEHDQIVTLDFDDLHDFVADANNAVFPSVEVADRGERDARGILVDRGRRDSTHRLIVGVGANAWRAIDFPVNNQSKTRVGFEPDAGKDDVSSRIVLHAGTYHLRNGLWRLPRISNRIGITEIQFLSPSIIVNFVWLTGRLGCKSLPARSLIPTTVCCPMSSRPNGVKLIWFASRLEFSSPVR